MATDGVKIVDGDTAHDTYWGIMDLYDSDASLDIIAREFPLIQSDFVDDFDREIYVTSCALALWEIGHMTEDKLDYIKSVINEGACVAEWRENDIRDGVARQKELDKFWRKISQPNTKVRTRKKYRKVTNLYFQSDDLLAFKLRDGNYRAVICAAVEQHRGQCNYVLVPTTYNSSEKPNANDLKDKEILGRQIGSGYNQRTTKEMQPGIERIWSLSGEDSNFFFGLVQMLVNHKDIIKFKDRFEKVGVLKIIEGLKRAGEYGYEDDFERFEHIFGNLENNIKIFQQKKYPVKVVCEV
jgi:hypothetical protein